MRLNDKQLDAAREYIHEQFKSHSWWPKAQPREAEREFELMCKNVSALNVWCDRWLNDSQKAQLEKRLHQAAS